jgi:hypothetical protein
MRGSTAFWLSIPFEVPCRNERKPRRWPGLWFLEEANSDLHGSDKIGNDDGSMFLKQLGHAGGHAHIY